MQLLLYYQCCGSGTARNYLYYYGEVGDTIVLEQKTAVSVAMDQSAADDTVVDKNELLIQLLWSWQLMILLLRSRHW